MQYREENGSELRKAIEDLREKHGNRYSVEAYYFVLDAVASAIEEAGEPRHVSGRELCEQAQKLALLRFGPMAKQVLNFWGILSTEDIGKIVFQLVDAGELTATESDSMTDFIGVFDFDEAFEKDYFA